MSKEIPLTKGYVAIVSDEDYDRLSQYKWHYTKYAGRGVRIHDNYVKQEKMHHYILPQKDGYEIDHINGNRLDNRRENLRYATRSQNMMNRKMKPKTSAYFGVYLDDRYNYWCCVIKENKNRHFIGMFKSEIEAAIAFNINVEKYHGEFSVYNETHLTDEDAKEIIIRRLLENDEVKKRIGCVIKNKRLQKNLLQSDLGRLSSTSQCYVSACELANTTLVKKRIERITNALNINLETILFNNQIKF